MAVRVSEMAASLQSLAQNAHLLRSRKNPDTATYNKYASYPDFFRALHLNILDQALPIELLKLMTNSIWHLNSAPIIENKKLRTLVFFAFVNWAPA